ncbi:MAG: response regulator, partial [Planctomycetes bacterium]|nr:response regulator [Planctomycetota bacterium]
MTTVLAIDNQPDNLELLSQILEDDYDVITARSGAEGLQRAEADHPEVILLDVQMPEMDGYEVFQKLQQNESTRAIPVIFVTGRDPDRLAKGLELGAFDYISNPFDDEVLLARVAVAARISRADEALRESESRNRAILAAIADLTFRIHRDGTFLDWHTLDDSESTIPRNQFIGHRIQEVMAAPFANLIMQHARAALASGQVQMFECQLPIPLDSDDLRDFEGRLVVCDQDEVLAICRDVTERKHTEEALQRSESLHGAILEAAPQIIWQADADGSITYINQAWEDTTGMPKEEALGSGWTSVIHPDDAPELIAKWERAYAHGESYSGECRFRSKDGSYRTFDFVGTPVRDTSGKIIR